MAAANQIKAAVRGGSEAVGVVRRNHGHAMRSWGWVGFVGPSVGACFVQYGRMDHELITEFDWKNAVNELGEQQQVAVAHDRISSVERRASPDRFARGSPWACLSVRHDMLRHAPDGWTLKS